MHLMIIPRLKSLAIIRFNKALIINTINNIIPRTKQNLCFSGTSAYFTPMIPITNSVTEIIKE